MKEVWIGETPNDGCIYCNNMNPMYWSVCDKHMEEVYRDYKRILVTDLYILLKLIRLGDKEPKPI